MEGLIVVAEVASEILLLAVEVVAVVVAAGAEPDLSWSFDA